MRHNQMERYGANVQHWLPSVIANKSGMGLRSPTLGAQVRRFRARNVRF
jgi:hypothetical protein